MIEKLTSDKDFVQVRTWRGYWSIWEASRSGPLVGGQTLMVCLLSNKQSSTFLILNTQVHVPVDTIFCIPLPCRLALERAGGQPKNNLCVLFRLLKKMTGGMLMYEDGALETGYGPVLWTPCSSGF